MQILADSNKIVDASLNRLTFCQRALLNFHLGFWFLLFTRWVCVVKAKTELLFPSVFFFLQTLITIHSR